MLDSTPIDQGKKQPLLLSDHDWGAMAQNRRRHLSNDLYKTNVCRSVALSRASRLCKEVGEKRANTSS